MPAIRPITSRRPAACAIATDYSGVYTTGRLPDVVTMNRAHSTHYTLNPDPASRRCCMAGATTASPPISIQRIGDVLIRNVTTDIRRYMFDDSNGG